MSTPPTLSTNSRYTLEYCALSRHSKIPLGTSHILEARDPPRMSTPRLRLRRVHLRHLLLHVNLHLVLRRLRRHLGGLRLDHHRLLLLLHRESHRLLGVRLLEGHLLLGKLLRVRLLRDLDLALRLSIEHLDLRLA